MSKRGRLLALVFVAAGAVALPAETSRLPAAADRAIAQITADELRTHVAALASDEMAGRAVGHAGNQQAVQYVAEALRQARVEPATGTYFHAVELYQPTLSSDGRLTIDGADKEPIADLTPGTTFHPLPESSDATVSGPLVSAGHGISAAKLGHDDYAGRDVRGAIAVVHDGAPDGLLRRAGGLTEGERIGLATLERKISDAAAHGAIGVIVVRASPDDVRMVWPAPSGSRSASYRLQAGARHAPMAVAVISQTAAEPVLNALRSKSALTATLRPGIVVQRITVHNVLGTLEPARGGDELVVVGAHLDHEGLDEDGRVYNGADDNASGTAAVLAMAAALTRASAAGQRPRRRIVFALWNAEEQGSLGAEAFAAAPRPSGRVVANVNLDMIGRGEEVPDPKDPRYRGFRRTTEAENANVVHVLGYSYSPDFATLARRANDTIGLTIKEEYDRGAQGLLQRSDNWPFLKRTIPALFFTTGLHPDYHTLDDDVERIDFKKLERITELVSRLAWLVADGEPLVRPLKNAGLNGRR